MSEDDLRITTDSIQSSLGKLSTVIDSMDNHSYDMKHSNFEISKAIQKLNDDMFEFEKNDMKENFTDIASSSKFFTGLLIVIMTALTIYYFMFYKKQNE
jgi:hypothetical protein